MWGSLHPATAKPAASSQRAAAMAASFELSRSQGFCGRTAPAALLCYFLWGERTAIEAWDLCWNFVPVWWSTSFQAGVLVSEPSVICPALTVAPRHWLDTFRPGQDTFRRECSAGALPSAFAGVLCTKTTWFNERYCFERFYALTVLPGCEVHCSVQDVEHARLLGNTCSLRSQPLVSLPRVDAISITGSCLE